ncbi:inositol monophosphatase (Extragenic suppressor protein) [Lentisphaera araneosa HTCC2155]|uniref:Inositol-1-monophosphatase n=1 Tax=Lentisphaera araneosa HTCC2155 TaxID=313628 RepID=A6DIQ2_9BACT|nr:inositol monophosphatase [Lentisphaera araneosa]EDM28338.1 inositol monophosphatase (Extragenic suppressor protein) [Lentisphaera araneosa HTCC2155]
MLLELDRYKFIEEVERLLQGVGDFQLDNFRDLEVQEEEKEPRELVSFVDRQSESMLFEGLSPLYPEAEFWGEENGKRGEADWMWLVDPLDGTTNYLNHLDQFSISVALLYKGKPQFGAVYKPISSEFFHAFKGLGFFHNHKQLHSLQTQRSFEKAMIGTGFPYRSPDLKDQFFSLIEDLMPRCRGIRRFGSAALDLSYVAAGWLQGFWESDLQPYDVGAGLLFLEEMGMTVSNHKGEAYDMNVDRMLVTAKPEVHKELLARVADHYGEEGLQF